MLMGKRKHPFGYTMRCGKYVICDSEADSVKSIFAMYTQGISFSEIAGSLKTRQIEYSKEHAWNKNIVARILEDSRYIGCNGYPPIISKQEFYAVARIRKAKILPGKRTIAQKVLRKKCDKSHSPNTEAQVISILNLLIKHPDLIRPHSDLHHSSRADILQDQLDAIMLRQPIDEAAAMGLIFKIAEAQYAQIDSSAYETERLLRLMLRSEPTDNLNAALLEKSVDKVLINNNSIQVILKNGQVISLEEVR